MLSGETPARAATAAIVVGRNPSRSNSSRAASTTARRRARACSRRPAGFHATALWLRAGFAGLRYDIHAIADGTLVAVNSTMNGRHVAPWAVYTDDGAIDTVFPPTGKTFAMTQSHWFRIEDGQIFEHWANRDDL